jgi:hypothetical protein
LGYIEGPSRIGAKVGKLLYFQELKTNVDSSDEYNAKTDIRKKRIVAASRLKAGKH